MFFAAEVGLKHSRGAWMPMGSSVVLIADVLHLDVVHLDVVHLIQ